MDEGKVLLRPTYADIGRLYDLLEGMKLERLAIDREIEQ